MTLYQEPPFVRFLSFSLSRQRGRLRPWKPRQPVILVAASAAAGSTGPRSAGTGVGAQPVRALAARERWMAATLMRVVLACPNPHEARRGRPKEATETTANQRLYTVVKLSLALLLSSPEILSRRSDFSFSVRPRPFLSRSLRVARSLARARLVVFFLA